MTITRIPVGLPHPNPTEAYWQNPPHSLANHRTTPSLPPTADYIIIGSGITGSLIAHQLLTLQPHSNILLLEARTACSGATGRNGGHCRAGRYLEFGTYVEKFGEDEALRMEKLEEENVANVGLFVEEFGIECDLTVVETLDVFTDEGKWERALEALKARQRVLMGKVNANVLLKHRVWSARETREELLIPEGVGAISFPAYTLSPYKLVCGILEMCLAKGLNLQTTTPVLAVEQYKTREGGKKWTVSTGRGEVTAGKVILATNAYTSALYPPLAEFIVPTRAQVVAMRPGTKIEGNPVLKRSACLESKTSGDYIQTRPERSTGVGDVIIGGGRSFGTPLGRQGEQPILDDSVIHPRISKYLRTACVSYYGRENWGEDGKVLQEWTGIMGYTLDSQPVVGEAPGQQGLWICAGFNGHGMALTYRSAEALVQLMMGREKEVDEWLPKCYRLDRVLKKRGEVGVKVGRDSS